MQSTEPDKPANPVHHGMRAVITVALFGSAVLLLLAMLLPQLARSKGGPATGCPANLRAIYLAKAVLADDRKLTNGMVVAKEELLPYVQGGWPRCPQGGDYSLGRIGEPPRCSFPQHTNLQVTWTNTMP
jgi:hypothetical protein